MAADFTWEQAIAHLRAVPEHSQFIFDAYLTEDLAENCRRFAAGEEFREVLRLIAAHARGSRVLDMPAGNGIATCALAAAGYYVTAVEPDPSATLGRGAIARVLRESGLAAQIVDARGEALPFADGNFDVVYVRQGLHHAGNLPRMVGEISRVLRAGGILLACREHVVDDYEGSLRAFLASQVDHQLYGGENAFTLTDYRRAISLAGFALIKELGPYESPINLYPNTEQSLERKILDTRAGRLLSGFMPNHLVARLGMWQLRRRRAPGRLFSFVARKPEA
jgi:ubiquinone/menaquinone biosynthesis C-methylase UbiE